MQARVQSQGFAFIIAGMCTALLTFSGVASAQIPKKPDQKCINNINKGAAKVAKAQAGDNNACVKDYGKEKVGSAADCVTSDPKGKVSKAISKIKTGDCAGVPAALPGLDTNSASIGAGMVSKDLALLTDLFGSDLDSALVLAATDKPGSKCQSAVIKAAGKCQAAKLSSFNSCKKAGMKDDSVTDAASLRDECLGTGAGSIPDGKGKIAKKCGGDFDLGKKCSGQDLEALFPGFNPHVSADAIDTAIECRVCLALNALDGLTRNCDLFDNGVADGSCDAGGLSCQHNVEAFCAGGTNDTNPCTDVFGSSDCPPGSPDGRCTPISFASLESISVPNGLNFALIGGSSFVVGEVDPDTGIASMECGLTEPIGLVIPSLLVACLTEVGGCDPGIVDCNGGTALDLSTVHHHSVDELLLDPNDPLNAAWVAADPNFVGTDCRGVDPACFVIEDPSCTANETCAAMCDVYCASLSGNYTRSDSGCEGFCRGGTTDRELCTLDTECQQGGINNSGDCIGGNPVAHQGSCTCDCLEIGSAGPSPAGSFWCQVGLQTVTEALTGTLCDGQDIITIIGQQCVVRTSETITNTVLYAEDDPGLSINQFDQGSRISCNDLLAGNMSGMAQAGNQTSYDGDLGDSATRTVQVCQ